jgi:hypothetical protein
MSDMIDLRAPSGDNHDGDTYVYRDGEREDPNHELVHVLSPMSAMTAGSASEIQPRPAWMTGRAGAPLVTPGSR